MERIDKIIFGDNQFFGINHMSQEKAQQLAQKFFDTKNIYRVYDCAFDNGIRAVMLNSNQRAVEICDYFRQNKSKYADIAWYPSLPYAHKYANMVAEMGIFPTINEVIFKDNSAMGALGMVAKGGMALFGKDAIKMMQMLVDAEAKMFKGLNMKVLFLQNIVTDLMLGYGIKTVFEAYSDYVRKKYGVLPGFVTQNMPYLKSKLEEWGVEDVVICSSINKIGYLMSPSVDAYVDAIQNNDSSKYQLIAMSTMASGAVKAKEAYEFVNKLNVQAVVFGASQEKNIKETVGLIHIRD